MYGILIVGMAFGILFDSCFARRIWDTTSAMASNKAKRILAGMGYVLRNVHTGLELANFAAGTGKRTALGETLPYHVLRMDERTGDSKRTVGHAATLADARKMVADAIARDWDRSNEYGNVRDTLQNRGGSEIVSEAGRFTYYVRDIRNGAIYRR